MILYIDSAVEQDVRAAKALGYVRGVTTNPTLLAQAGLPPTEAIHRLAAMEIGPLYVQLTGKTLAEMEAEAEGVRRLAPGALVLKIPPTAEGYHFVGLHGQQIRCCITAVFSPAQALAAAAAGAHSVAVYVNRASKSLGDGVGLVRAVAAVLAGMQTQILAASIKSPEEAVAAAVAGAQMLTVSLPVLRALIEHPLSAETVRKFDADGVGIL